MKRLTTRDDTIHDLTHELNDRTNRYYAICDGKAALLKDLWDAESDIRRVNFKRTADNVAERARLSRIDNAFQFEPWTAFVQYPQVTLAMVAQRYKEIVYRESTLTESEHDSSRHLVWVCYLLDHMRYDLSYLRLVRDEHSRSHFVFSAVDGESEAPQDSSISSI
ncbi:hypothetical protein P153DRAFT_391196 [Dothidotthia symphoricarpi CBS 119687]|uniref:Uncharacterized protein n=1 Tax=Dothidotthia symphoricarpi CBS 119687 TaxID=1392245 RepID=A0A6A5ZWV0_9PLEO|nr:uncharacterized protein P153DRAFT_391196 [Dothidotthia symphoricarpi CBS 119687]KAF2123776.1 hypothetical protein P153DRAFT_391196 [Dothidotthia symphoricarpi CBS 119687]